MSTRLKLGLSLSTLVVFFCLGAVPALAEGNCPPGMYEINGVGFQGCAPIPGYDDGGGYGGYGGGGGQDYTASSYDPVGSSGLGALFEMVQAETLAMMQGGAALPAASAAPAAPVAPKLPAGVKSIYQAADGIWLSFRIDGACAVAFGQGAQSLIFSGPTGKRPGAITFLGPDIAARSKPLETQVVLRADGKPAKVRAVHATSGGQGVIIVPTVITDTLKSLGDSEAVTVELGGRTVFSATTVASFAARDALLACLR